MEETMIFSPTTKIGPLDEELRKIEMDYREFIDSNDFGQEDWLEFLSKTEINKDISVRIPLSGNSDNKTYSWEQDNDIITIKIRVDKDDPLKITSKSIDCISIRGDFWKEVEIVNVMRSKNTATVVVRSSEHFPVLIRSGDKIDPLSSYFLASLSLILHNEEFFIKWATKAGFEGCSYAFYILGRHLNSAGKHDMAVYWMAKACLDSNDYSCIVTLAALMSKDTVSKPYYEFAENILCDAVNNGDNTASIELGVLYLNGGGDVEPDPEKGALLLNTITEQFDIGGETIQLINQSIMESNRSPLIEMLVTTGVVGAFVGLAVFLYKKYVKKNKVGQ